VTNAPIGACDHQIRFERYVVNPDDFRTLNYLGLGMNMRAPINGSNSVQIWIAGEPVQSNDISYGWQVVRDTTRIDIATADIFYKIMFNKPVRLVQPLIEVSYLTRQGFCLKCSALGFLNDLKIGAAGSFQQITQTNKLAQKALKWILTSTCPFYPTFICPLKSYIGRKLGIQITETDLQTQVLNALTQMQQVQRAQGTVQTLDPMEILKDIVNVSAAIDPSDPTTVRINAVVSSYSGTSAPLGFTLRVGS
jgi:hypothetical protein